MNSKQVYNAHRNFMFVNEAMSEQIHLNDAMFSSDKKERGEADLD